MMDTKMNSENMNQWMDNKCEDKPKFCDSPITVSETSVVSVDSTVDQTDACNQSNLHKNSKSRVSQAVSISGSCSEDKHQPRTLYVLPPSSTTINTEPSDKEDLCTSVLLACLFCQPLDCLLATIRGCSECFWCLSSSLCGCESTTLQPLLNITHHLNDCGCQESCCFLCDCQSCDVCLPVTECLDLAMEISQMLYH